MHRDMAGKLWGQLCGCVRKVHPREFVSHEVLDGGPGVRLSVDSQRPWLDGEDRARISSGFMSESRTIIPLLS